MWAPFLSMSARRGYQTDHWLQLLLLFLVVFNFQKYNPGQMWPFQLFCLFIPLHCHGRYPRNVMYRVMLDFIAGYLHLSLVHCGKGRNLRNNRSRPCPEKGPVFHVICTPQQPGTTHFRCEWMEMIFARGLPSASGFMAFDCVFVVKSRRTPGMSRTPERASGE
jgi:hypothetical protein